MRPPSSLRALVLGLALAAALGAGGCRKPNQGAARVVVIGSGLQIADPASGPLTAPQSVLLANAAQGLVRFDARGQIEPGLAERWNVTDDGLSYIFRLQSAEWSGGGKVTAHQVARLLRRQVATRSRNPLKDAMGGIEEIVSMTDRVLEIRLKAPRPSLLQLLAQPELAIVRDGAGTGPFAIVAGERPAELRLTRSVASPEEEDSRREDVRLSAGTAREAVQAFLRDRADLVLGGTFGDLPLARADGIPRGALHFDPAAGLFGLVPARADGPLAERELRALLSEAIDRQAFLDALEVPGLLPRATLLEPGLEGIANVSPPPWAGVPIGERRAALAARAQSLFGEDERPTLRIALPDGPGAGVLLNRLATDWGALGIRVEPAGAGPADLLLLDSVAPSTSPAWFVQQFRCGLVPICDREADELMEGARSATVSDQRAALIAQAAAMVDQQQLFLPIAAPIRWSLVSDRVPGFATNRFARHTLTGLRERLNRERAE